MRRLFYLITIFTALSCVDGLKIEYYGKIQGVVIDSQTDSPIKNASVSLIPSGERVLTDDNGGFFFSDIAPGEYTISVSNADYDTKRYNIEVFAGQYPSVQIKLDRIRFALEPTYSSVDLGTVKYHVVNTVTNRLKTAINYSITVSDDWIVVGKSGGTIVDKEDIDIFVERSYVNVGKYKGSIDIKTDYGSLTIPIYMEVSKDIQPTTASVTTTTAYPSEESAVLEGTINSIGNVSEVQCYGHIWSTYETPTFENGNYTSFEHAEEAIDFKSEVNGLTPSVKYYYRAYAINEVGTSYGDIKTFITKHPEPKAIDLGLPSGTKWANINIGARNEYDGGSKFKWGAISPYSDTYCTTINDIQGTEYDAANVLWGEGWTMPNEAQVKELFDNCKVEEMQNGYKLTSHINGNSITLPNKEKYWTCQANSQLALSFTLPYGIEGLPSLISKERTLYIRPIKH